MTTTDRKHCVFSKNNYCMYYLYYYIGELSSKFEEFLALRSQFDSDHGVDFSAPTCCESATFVLALHRLATASRSRLSETE